MKERFIENNIEYILAEEHRPALYMKLVLSGTLTTHLADINETARNRMEFLVKQMAVQQHITEQLKSSDWLKWLQSMNNIHHSAQEIVLSELIYF